MDEITTGSKLAVLVLVEISADFFPEGWLITYKLIDSVGKEAGIAISAETIFGPAFAELNLSFCGSLLREFGFKYGHAH